MKLLRWIIPSCLILNFGPTESQDATVAFNGARVHTVSGGVIARGTLVVQGSKIVSAGPGAASGPSRTVSLAGKVVIPGLIDACSHLLMDDAELASAGAPDRDVLDAADWYDEEVVRARRMGVTAAYISPGSRGTIGGVGAVVKFSGSAGRTCETLVPQAAIKLNLGVSDSGRSSSLERLAGYEALRTAFRSAEQYGRTLERYQREKPAENAPAGATTMQNPGARTTRPRRVPAQEVMLRALKREIPVRVEAHRADDILNATRLAAEFKLNLILEGAEEGPLVANELARRSIPVVWGPTLIEYTESLDNLSQTPAGAAKLARAGIRIALTPGGRGTRFLLENAALAAGHGLSRQSALRAITLDAARIIGAAERIGSLEKGKDADFVVLSGDPWLPETVVEQVYINGARVYAK